MKATVQDDIITNIIPSGDVEIGALPKGVGLERLRWDGEKIVDLAGLSHIWVTPDLILHAIEAPAAVLLDMKYSDRKRLINDNGTIRLKTSEDDEKELKTIRKNRLRQSLKKELGGTDDLLADAWKLICLLVSSRAGDPEASVILDRLSSDMSEIYPSPEHAVQRSVSVLKEKMIHYYSDGNSAEPGTESK